MSEKPNTGIVVGTNGSAGSARAVEYAALEAERLGVGLAIVHVLPDFTALAPTTDIFPTDLDADIEAIGRGVLQQAADAAAARGGPVTCQQVLRVGRTVPTLVEVGRDARMIVLGHETVTPLRRVHTGAVTMGVMARAGRPVVSVPADWRPPTGPARVVVGLKSSRHSAELLAAAFREASARDARLVVVHAWSLPSMYDDRIITRTREEAWTAAATRDVEGLLAGNRAEFPQVDVEVRTVHDQAAHALLGEVDSPDLLVLVRRAHGFPPATNLGGTTRALLHRASCPVMVLPAQDVIPEVQDLELETAGAREE